MNEHSQPEAISTVSSVSLAGWLVLGLWKAEYQYRQHTAHRLDSVIQVLTSPSW